MPESTETEQKTETVDIEKIAGDMAAMREQLDAEKQARATLQGQLAGIQQVTAAQTAPAEPAKKRYSRAELDAAVSAGTITEAQRDGYLDQVRSEEIDRLVNERVAEAAGRITTEAEDKAELDKYIEAVPTIMEQGSEDRARVQTEYDKLIARGLPESLSTQLLSVKTALGPVPTKRTDLAGERETDQAGAGGGGSAGGGKANDPLGGLKVEPRLKEHYQKLVDKGVTTWDAAKEELSEYVGAA